MTRLPNYLRTQFFKATRDCNLTNGTINPLTFKNWLERRVKGFFNPLAEITSIQEASTKHQQPLKEYFNKKIYFNFMNASDDKKESKAASEQPEMQNERKNRLTCWLCKEKHRLMNCQKFKMKLVKDRIDFAVKDNFCKKFFFQKLICWKICICICSIKCRVDGYG